MRSLLLLFVLMLTNELIQSEKVKRIFVVFRDNPLSRRQLSNYTIRDASEKNRLYRVKCSTSDIDQMILFDYTKNTVIGNVEGEWIAEVFNMSFSLLQTPEQPWIVGTIKSHPKVFRREYHINWDGKTVLMRRRYYSRIIQILDKQGKNVYGQFRRYNTFVSRSSKIKYTMKIYSDTVPLGVYFFGLAIIDHRLQVEQIETREG